jgi:hypothetical protein
MAENDEPLPAYAPDGVDLTLIRWMLSLTPAERLYFLQNHVNGILAIRALNGNAG